MSLLLSQFGTIINPKPFIGSLVERIRNSVIRTCPTRGEGHYGCHRDKLRYIW